MSKKKTHDAGEKKDKERDGENTGQRKRHKLWETKKNTSLFKKKRVTRRKEDRMTEQKR